MERKLFYYARWIHFHIQKRCECKWLEFLAKRQNKRITGSRMAPLTVTYPIFINRAIKSITLIYNVESFQHVCMHIHTIEHELEYVRHPHMKNPLLQLRM
jgi:hypothetical protein